MKPLPTETE